MRDVGREYCIRVRAHVRSVLLIACKRDAFAVSEADPYQ